MLTFHQLQKVSLFAPAEYVELSPEERDKIINGCGAAGARFDFVPDTIYGLDISEACNIHDYMYHMGETLEDKKLADRVFLNNMFRLIEARGGCLKRLRRRRALKYFMAVKYFGASAFWEGKNKPENLLQVEI